MKQHITQLGLHNPSEIDLAQGVFAYGRFEDNIREAPVRTTLHRHAFHELFIFESGEGKYHCDFAHHKIDQPCAIISAAGTVHEWLNADQLRGHAIAFDLDFLESHGRTNGPGAIFRPPIPVLIPLNQSQLASLQTLLQRIRDEWSHQAAHYRCVIRAVLALILIDLRRQHDELDEEHPSAMNHLYSSFLDTLEENWRSSPKPKKLAADLRVSPDHLSATLRQLTGKNTSDLIAERILLEAKRLLAHSRMGIAEVAYEIGFEDPSYFARFFKRKVGLSPKDFRESFKK